MRLGELGVKGDQDGLDKFGFVWIEFDEAGNLKKKGMEC